VLLSPRVPRARARGWLNLFDKELEHCSKPRNEQMTVNKPTTITARLSDRARKLAEAAAQLRRVTLSHFAADAIEEEARRELSIADGDACQTNRDAAPARGSRT